MSVELLLLLLSVDIVTTEHDNRVITTLKYSKYYVKPSVINGVPAKTGQVPYLVSLKERLVKISKIKSIWTNLCGGSIISKNKVLTAAHCFEGRGFFYHKHPEKLRVVAGNFTTELIHTGNTDTTKRAQWRKIKKVVLHKKFYFPENDIALVFVDSPFKYTVNVGFIPTARSRSDYPTNLECISAGFGSINYTKDEISSVLLVGDMFLMPRHNCSKMWEMNMDRFICTYSFMSDVGVGDSGGPLSCRGTLEKGDRELLVGVVSGKNFDKTTLFTRVSAYKQWIDQKQQRNDQDCARGEFGLVLLCTVILKSILFSLLYFISWASLPFYKSVY